MIPVLFCGLPLLPGQIALLKDILSLASLRDMALLGKKYSAAEALEWGFIDKAVPRADLLPEARQMAAQLGRLDPGGYAEIKKALRRETAAIIREQDSPVIARILRRMRGAN